MATSAKHLLQSPNPVIAARQKYDQGVLPTLLEIKVGAPSQIKGITLPAQSLKNFAETAKGTIREIGSTHWRVMDDHTLTEGAKLVRSATHAEQKIKLAREQFARIADNAADKIKGLEKELKTTLKPPTSAGEAMIDAELRALIRAESDVSKQLAMVRTDPAFRAATARAPAALSGLKSDIHDSIQAEHMKATDPETFEIYEDLQAAFNSANQALKAIEDQAKELIDFDTARELGSKQVINI